MLSGHSFNALLKTLEEPPPHVKFLLATTEPQKIPVTVLSRCLQFNLKRLLPEQIDSQMRFILGQEQIEFEENAIKILSRAADGSMRDGLSLLDQAISYGNGRVAYDDVVSMLGSIAQQPIDDILQALAANDGKALLATIDEVSSLTPDFSEILQQILRVLHRVALTQQLPDLVDHEFDKQLIDRLMAQLLPEDVQLFYQIGLMGQRDLDLAPDPRSGFEMVMLRMLTFKPRHSAAGDSPAQQNKAPQSAAKPSSADQEQPSVSHSPAIVQTEQSNEATPSDEKWPEIIQAMKIRGMTKELANNCVYEGVDESSCRLIIDPGHKHLLGSKAEEKLQKAMQDYFGKSLKLKITMEKTDHVTPAVQILQDREDQQQAAVDAIKSLKEHFDARVMPGTIEPINE
jgi:DNA polymerase-3 subunit gamma/tau